MNLELALRGYVVETCAIQSGWVHGTLKEKLWPKVAGDRPVLWPDKPNGVLKAKIADPVAFLQDFANSPQRDEDIVRFVQQYGVFNDRAVITKCPDGLPQKVRRAWNTQTRTGAWPYAFRTYEFTWPQEEIKTHMKAFAVLASGAPQKEMMDGLNKLGLPADLPEFVRNHLYSKIEQNIRDVEVEVDDINGAPSIFLACKTLAAAAHLALMAHILRGETFASCLRCGSMFLRTRDDRKFCTKICQNRYKTSSRARQEAD